MRAFRSASSGVAQGWMVVALVGLGAAAFACSSGEEKERPPYFGGCGGAGCSGVGDGGGSVTPGSGGSSSTDGGEGGDGSVETTGSVGSYTDAGFVTTAPVTESLTVHGSSPAGWVTGTYDGTSFTLAGVDLGKTVWMAAEADDVSQYYRTLARQDTAAKKSLTLPLVKTTLIDQIYSIAAVSETPETTAGQIVVQLVDSSGAGVAGVKVSVSEASFVAYSDANNNSWLTTLTATSADGMALVGNVPAKKFPGGEVELILTGNVKRSLSVLVVANSVSVLRVPSGP